MRGFRIRKRFSGLINRLISHRRRRAHVHRRQIQTSMFAWIKKRAGSFLNRNRTAGYARLQERGEPVRVVGVPKGHLAVHVGQKEEEWCQVTVPVVYFNHPLFGRLLTHAEEKFGFDYPGRITIPCPVSEFRSVTSRIEATVRSRTR